MAAVAPFAPGTRVRATYRVEPFAGDEVLVVLETARHGRGRGAVWRVHVEAVARTGVSGWLYAGDPPSAEEL